MERRHRNIVSRNGPESKSAFEPYIKPIRLTSQLTSCHQIWQNQLFTQHPSLMCTATNPYKGRARSPRRHQVGGFYFLLRVRLSAQIHFGYHSGFRFQHQMVSNLFYNGLVTTLTR